MLLHCVSSQKPSSASFPSLASYSTSAQIWTEALRLRQINTQSKIARLSRTVLHLQFPFLRQNMWSIPSLILRNIVYKNGCFAAVQCRTYAWQVPVKVGTARMHESMHVMPESWLRLQCRWHSSVSVCWFSWLCCWQRQGQLTDAANNTAKCLWL